MTSHLTALSAIVLAIPFGAMSPEVSFHLVARIVMFSSKRVLYLLLQLLMGFRAFNFWSHNISMS